MTSNLLAMASTLVAMASTHVGAIHHRFLSKVQAETFPKKFNMPRESCSRTSQPVPLRFGAEVMMFGMTGSGKSALGNLLAGYDHFVSGDDTAA